MEKNKNFCLNIWSKHSKIVGARDLSKIHQGILSGFTKELTNKIRNATTELEKNNLKKQLHAFTVSGIFKQQRRLEDLLIYTGLLVLDIDHLKPEQVNVIAANAKAMDYSILVFISPSGLGVKIIVAVDSTQAQHEIAYTQVVNHYQNKLGVEFDRKTKDITRLCYMSFDENAYYEPNAKVFHVNSTEPQIEALTEVSSEENFEKKVQYIEFKTSRNGAFIKGNRNSFIHNFACNANRLAMRKDVLTNYLLSKYLSLDYEKEEIISSIESAYRNVDQHGTYNYPPFVKSNSTKQNASSIHEKSEMSEQPELKLDSPLISEFVKENLPSFLKEILVRLIPREQDVFIIGTITALSGCVEASGLYKDKRYYSPCYSFISAPSASGKGALNHCMQLILPLHMAIKKQSEDALRIYDNELLEYEQKKKSGENNIDKPEKPFFQTVMIPANSSSSQLIEHLQNNGEQGLMIETEADTMVKMLESDFGNYSDILRKASEHEPISQRRKTDKLYIDMYNPRLAVCLSGTPKQLSKLITSVENGLFSRFVYYVFSSTPKWSDVTPSLNEEISLPDLIKGIGQELSVKLIELRKEPLQFHLEINQWKKLNEVFADRVAQFSCFVGEEASPNIFRLAVSTFRIAMTLTVLRMIEAGLYVKSITCSETEFEMAMSLSETFFQHLIFAFKVVKNSNEILNKQLQRFFDILPNSFDRKMAIEKAFANGQNCHERTIDKYLKRLVEYSFLAKNEYNNYEKSRQSNVAA